MTTTTITRRCCGTSVGGRIRRTIAGRTEYALLGRAWWPIGWAMVAGHAADEGQASPEAALVAETAEELGLTVQSCTPLLAVDLPNLCQSPPARPVAGHRWTVYDVEVAPDTALCPDPTETTGAEWISGEELQRLAEATIAYARTGRPARDQHRLTLEAVWVELLARTGDITATAADRQAVARLYTTPPDEYWTGGGLVPAHHLARGGR
ncbi:NUDIX hydrolase (plasmid) [Thermobifida halotolerans]|uniref:NUDIX hydrolase n=1 Tax=Thermobifida halotolerans TaxID=483545 RepID=A0AA97M1J6_9ACTN|nr:NUDIX hydrolase [Thermobifida halotolerans]UOE22287.1 NUDIX hydrolase [Thermobifida halotolerans]